MRPLAVLALVLAAIATLVVAFLALGDRSGGGRTPTRVVPESPERGVPATDPLLPSEPRADPSPAPERTAVAAEVEGEVEPAPRTGWIRGEVTTLDGTPVDEAQVSLVRDVDGSFGVAESLSLFDAAGMPEPRARALTRGDGRFEFLGIEPGNQWYVVVAHASYPRTSAGPIAVPEEGGVDERVVLRSGLAMFGTVTDAVTGLPIPGAVLRLENPLSTVVSKSDRPEPAEKAVCDEVGRFEFQKIGAGQRALEIRAPGYATAYVANFSSILQLENAESRRPKLWRTNRGQQLQEIAERPNEPVEMSFELAPGRAIAGRVVVGDGGGQVPAATVTAILPTADTGSRGEAAVAADGSFRIEDLAEGQYTVFARAECFQVASLNRVDAGDEEVELRLLPMGGVAGRVVDGESGRAVSRFTVRVRDHNPDNLAWGGEVAKRQVRDAQGGGFRVDGVPPGTYVVEAVASGFASSFSAPFQVDQGARTEGVLVRLTRGGTLRGRVLDGASKEPIAGATVRTEDNHWVDSEIMRMIGAIDPGATSKVATRTDAEGRWELELLTPGTYQVRVSAEGYATVAQNDVQVLDGPATELVPFELLQGATVTGVVLGPFDDPVPGANVNLRAVEGGGFDTYPARTDANGRYTIHNARAGIYKLNASRPASPSSSPFRPVLELRQSEIEVTIAEGGRYDYELRLPAVAE